MSPELEKLVDEIKAFNWVGIRQPARRIGIARRFTQYRCELEDQHLQVGIYHKPITYKTVICDRLPKYADNVSDETLQRCQSDLDDMYTQQEKLIAQIAE